MIASDGEDLVVAAENAGFIVSASAEEGLCDASA